MLPKLCTWTLLFYQTGDGCNDKLGIGASLDRSRFAPQLTVGLAMPGLARTRPEAATCSLQLVLAV